MKSHAVGSSCATRPGVRRMPEPIVFPTVTERPNTTPRTASRPRLGRAIARTDSARAPAPSVTREEADGCSVLTDWPPHEIREQLVEVVRSDFATLGVAAAIVQPRAH